MSNWKIIRPAGRINLIRNPQFFWNITDGWESIDNGSGADHDWDDDHAWWGPGSCKITAGTDSAAIYSTGPHPRVEVGETVTITFRFMGDSGTDIACSIYDSTNDTSRATGTSTATGVDEWIERTVSWTNTTGSAVNIAAHLVNDEKDSSSRIWFDAVVLEIGSQTTYFDGDEDGCIWLGTPHDSFSRRGSNARSGGTELDLKDDFGFGVDTMIDAGAPPMTNYIHSYAIRPGGEIAGNKIHARAFSLVGTLVQRGDEETIHALRNALMDEILPWAYAKVRGQYQPLKLIYEGAAVTKYIRATYEHPSLAGALGVEEVFSQFEKPSLNFLADDPFWYAERPHGEYWFAQNRITGVKHMAQYDHEAHSWTTMNVLSNPAAGSVRINDIAFNPVDGKIYVIGNFEDWNGTTDANYFVRYNPYAKEWETPGTNWTVNNEVVCLAIAANGDIYIGGAFTSVEGTSGYDGLARYDLSADTILQVGSGGEIGIYAMDFDADGNLWIGGLFTNWNGDSDADYLIYWDGSAFQNMGADSPNFTVLDMKIIRRKVYVCGGFTNHATYLGMWDIEEESWTDLNPSSVGNVLKHLAVGLNGEVYAALEDSYSGRVYRFVSRSGQQIGQELTDGASDGTIDGLAFAPDGTLWTWGLFSTADGSTNEYYSGVAKFNGQQWVSPGFGLGDLGANAHVRTVTFRDQDPTDPTSFDIMIGTDDNDFDVHGAGVQTVTNNGNAEARPMLALTPGDSGSGRLAFLRNEVTGQEVYFNYDLVESEVLFLYFEKAGLRIVSSLRGVVKGAVVSGGDEATFVLSPGDNDIAVYVVGDPNTFQTFISLRDTYAGVD